MEKNHVDMEKSYVYVSHQIASGACFGARQDSGEQVFVPASVAKACDAQEGHVRESKLIPNTHENRDLTPWVVVHMSKIDGAENQHDIDERLLLEIEQAGYAATAELAGYLKETPVTVQRSLERLFRSNKVVKCEVYTNPRPAPPEICLWALSINSFVE